MRRQTTSAKWLIISQHYTAQKAVIIMSIGFKENLHHCNILLIYFNIQNFQMQGEFIL